MCRTVKLNGVVKELKSMGLCETSSPDDNPVISQASFDYHSGKLSRMMTSTDEALARLHRTILVVMESYGTSPLLTDASDVVRRLSGSPGDGALEVYSQLAGDIEDVEEFLEKWNGSNALNESRVLAEMWRTFKHLCKLQTAVDRAPVSFHLKNEEILNEHFGKNKSTLR